MFKFNCIITVFMYCISSCLNVHISNKAYNSVIFLLDLFLTTLSASSTFQFEIWENLVRNLFF